jgi:4-diphosphocytidyl-2-C-methyl-D-erythritol kinase
MSPFTETAYAKINLAIHVRRRRVDGYHELESLFAFADQGDRLTIEQGNGLSLRVTGPFAGELSYEPDNLVLRAAAILAKQNGIDGHAAFTLEKNLPVASGIGGGSADAAAALRLAARLWKLDAKSVQPIDIAPLLGADVPACIASQTCLGSGIGDCLQALPELDLAGIPILLVNPRVACPTAPVFQAWDGVDRGALNVSDWQHGRNDLEPAATALHPEIADVLQSLQKLEPRLARMSGSGATCFALFDTRAHCEAACAIIADEHPEYWTMAASLR